MSKPPEETVSARRNTFSVSQKKKICASKQKPLKHHSQLFADRWTEPNCCVCSTSFNYKVSRAKVYRDVEFLTSLTFKWDSTMNQQSEAVDDRTGFPFSTGRGNWMKVSSFISHVDCVNETVYPVPFFRFLPSEIFSRLQWNWVQVRKFSCEIKRKSQGRREGWTEVSRQKRLRGVVKLTEWPLSDRERGGWKVQNDWTEFPTDRKFSQLWLLETIKRQNLRRVLTSSNPDTFPQKYTTYLPLWQIFTSFICWWWQMVTDSFIGKWIISHIKQNFLCLSACFGSSDNLQSLYLK